MPLISFNVFDYIPTSWEEEKVERVWQTAYQMNNVNDSHLAKGIVSFGLSDVQAIIIRGALSYHKIIGTADFLKNGENRELKLNQNIKEEKTPNGYYLLLITPEKINGVEIKENVIKEKIANSLSILRAINGRNMAHKNIFEQVISLKNNEIVLYSPIIQNLHWFKSPNLSEEYIKLFTSVSETIDKISVEEQKKILLSLRWFNASLNESGVDALIKIWIALETIGMPNTTNIKPLNERLEKIYCIGLEEVQSQFKIGRIFGLRSKIVHNGYAKPVSSLITEYLEDVYVDIFFDYIGQASEYRAATRLENELYKNALNEI